MGDLFQLIAPGRRLSVVRLIAVTAPVWASLILISNVAFADNSESSQTEQVRTDPQSSSPTQDPNGDDRKQKVQIVQTAMLLLLGIAFVGLMLLGLVILWGVSVRRNAKKSLPTQMELDELWYLKPDKETASADLVGDAGDDSNVNESGGNGLDQS